VRKFHRDPRLRSVTHRTGLLTLVLGLAFSVQAAEAPPPPDLTVFNGVEPTARDPGQTLRFGPFEAKLEETKLGDIQKRFGGGTPAQRGDASEYLRWVCYSLPKQLVWLASGELGGGEYLNQVYAETVAASDPRFAACPAIPERLRPPSFAWGWLGSKRGALEKALGPASAKQGDSAALWRYAGKTPAPFPFLADQGRMVDMDLSADVEVRFRDEVVALEVSYITTY
jgi:hypothetical protein